MRDEMIRKLRDDGTPRPTEPAGPAEDAAYLAAWLRVWTSMGPVGQQRLLDEALRKKPRRPSPAPTPTDGRASFFTLGGAK